LRRYAFALALSEFIFVYSFERVYFIARGLSITQMIALEVLYSVLVFALDIPTGALADRWGRKPMLVAARIFAFFYCLILGLATNLGMFVLATFSAALGTVCASGTENAFVYDTLKERAQDEDFERVQGRLELLSNSAVMICGVIGAVIANWSLRLPYFITCAFLAAAAIATLSLREPAIATEPQDREEGREPEGWSFVSHIRDAMRFALSHATLRTIFVYGAVLGSVFVYADEYYQVYANAIDFPLYLFGLLSAAAVLIQSSGAALAYRVRARFGYERSLNWLVVLAALLLFLASQFRDFVGLALILLMFGAPAMARTLNYGLLHAHVDSAQRATVDSAYTMLVNLTSVGVGFAFAVVADRYSIFAAYLFLAALVALYGAYYLAGRKGIMAGPGSVETTGGTGRPSP